MLFLGTTVSLKSRVLRFWSSPEQKKGWMDKRTMKLLYNKVYEPYCQAHHGKSTLLLDDIICLKYENWLQEMEEDDVMRIMIPPHYTEILQPCDVGINKPLKDRLKNLLPNRGRTLIKIQMEIKLGLLFTKMLSNGSKNMGAISQYYSKKFFYWKRLLL